MTVKKKKKKNIFEIVNYLFIIWESFDKIIFSDISPYYITY